MNSENSGGVPEEEESEKRVPKVCLSIPWTKHWTTHLYTLSSLAKNRRSEQRYRVCSSKADKNLHNFMLFRMQSKVSQHPRNQENGTCSLHKRKSIGINLKTNQMLKLTDKDLKAVTVTLLNVFVAWNMFLTHENLSRDMRRLNWEIMTIKKSVVCRYEILTPNRININNPTSRHIIVKTVESQ